MNKVADGIDVDAGMIIICDLDYLLKNTDFTRDECLAEIALLGKLIEVPPGIYDVTRKIADTWNGPVRGEGTVDVSSGNLVVIDPCYVIQHDNQDKWCAWLDKVDFGNDPEENTLVLNSMGGDGCYKVELSLIGKSKYEQA